MTGVRPDPLDPELLAKARLKIAEARKQGFRDAEIDAYLKSEIGAGLADITKPNERDFWRTTASGLTFGHGDEIAGLISKISGGDYTHARDAAREESAGFRATSPKLNFATEVVSGGLPAAATTPIFGPGGWIKNALKAMGASGAMGAASGAGHSEGESAGEVAKDAAVTGGISTVLGGLLSAGGSGAGAVVRKIADAAKPARPVVREAATQLPKNAAETVARQEAMAPGTAALADLSPEMQALVRGVGADAKTGVSARVAAEDRLGLMENAIKGIRARYESMNQPLPVDSRLRDILATAGRANALKAATPKPQAGERLVAAASRTPEGRVFTGPTHGEAMNEATSKLGKEIFWREADQGFLTSTGRFVSRKEAYKIAKEMGPMDTRLHLSDKDNLDASSLMGGRQAMPPGEHGPTIDFTDLQRIRTALRAEARASRNSAVRHDKNAAVKQITEWLEGHMPDLKQVDSDFAFLSDRIGAARKTLREVTSSSKNYAASRAYGEEAGSIGGSLPQGSRGLGAEMMSRAIRPNRAGRARAANELLLTPGDATRTALERIAQARAGMSAPQGNLPPALRSLLFGDAVPTAPGLLMSP